MASDRSYPDPYTFKTDVYGYVDYNKPLLFKDSDYRTVYNIGVRNIRPVGEDYDVKQKVKISENLTCGNMKIRDETYRNYTHDEYVFKSPNTFPAVKYTRPSNIASMNGVQAMQEKFFAKPPPPRKPIVSEAKSQYQQKFPDPKPFRLNLTPEPNAICPVKALGRDELPPYPPEMQNYVRWLDPYVSTTRGTHVPFNLDQQNGVAKKDIITFYDVSNVPKAKGFGPRVRPTLDPLLSRRKQPVYDKVLFKFWPKNKLIPETTRAVPHSGLKSEYQGRFVPLNMHPMFNDIFKPLLDYPDALPNASANQNLAPPGMYETDYSHFGSGWPVRAVIDQNNNKTERFARKPCCMKVQ